MDHVRFGPQHRKWRRCSVRQRRGEVLAVSDGAPPYGAAGLLGGQRFIRERRSSDVIDLVAIEGPLGMIDQCVH